MNGCQYGGEALDQRDQVRRPHNVHAAGERRRRERHTDQRRVSTVGAAHDRDLVLAGDALVDRPVDGVDQIVVHLSGELVRRSSR